MIPIQLFQRVRLRRDLPDIGLRSGTQGRVVDLNPLDPIHVEVEFHIDDGSKHGRFLERIVPIESLEVLGPAS